MRIWQGTITMSEVTRTVVVRFWAKLVDVNTIEFESC